MDLVGLLDAIEFSFIEVALECADGNMARAARALELNRTTFVEKVKRLGIAPERFRSTPLEPSQASQRVSIQKQDEEWRGFRPNAFYAHKIHTILEALKQSGGNRTQAAKLIGVSLRSLRMWIKEAEAKGLEVPPAPLICGRQKSNPLALLDEKIPYSEAKALQLPQEERPPRPKRTTIAPHYADAMLTALEPYLLKGKTEMTFAELACICGVDVWILRDAIRKGEVARRNVLGQGYYSITDLCEFCRVSKQQDKNNGQHL